MNLTDSFTLKCLRGSPVFLDDICAIFPAKLGEIVDLGYDTFWQYLQILLAEKPILDKKDELYNLLKDLSDFEYFLLMVNLDAEMLQKAKEAFKFFTKESVVFSLEPAQIIVGPLEEKHLITEEKFYELRKILKRMYFIEQQEGEEIIIYDNDSPKVKELKAQMKRNREKVAKAKAKQKQQEGNDLKFSDLIASVTVGNCDLNIGNIWDITYYAFHDQLKRMGWRDQFNINNRAALAGAKLKKSQLKHWIKSIASDDKKE